MSVAVNPDGSVQMDFPRLAALNFGSVDVVQVHYGAVVWEKSDAWLPLLNAEGETLRNGDDEVVRARSGPYQIETVESEYVTSHDGLRLIGV